MPKKLLIGVVVFAVLLLLAITYITAKYIDQEEILRVTKEREQLQQQREELLALVAEKDAQKKELEAKVGNLESEVELKRAEVDSLEGARQEAQTSVRKLRTENELENQLMEAFPEVKESMKMTEVPVDGLPGMKLHYFSVPFRFAETFLIEHQNSKNYMMQRDQLKEVDQMQQKIISLEKNIVVLEEEKTAAYKTGYDSAYVKYLAINEKYEELLKNPPSIEFGLPQIGTIIGGTAAGILIGTQLK